MEEGFVSMEALPAADFGEWDAFLSRASRATVFHTAWWHRAWGVEPRVLVRRGRDGAVEAGMLLYISRFPSVLGRFGVLGLRRPPLTPTNGPIFPDCPKQGRSSVYTHEKREMLEAVAALPRLGFYDFGLGRGDYDVTPFLWNGFDTHVLYTYVIPAGEAEVWRKNVSEKTRRALKSAHREFAEKGCSFEAGPPFGEVKQLFFETAESKGFSLDRYSLRLSGWWAEVERMKAGRAYAVRDAAGVPLCSTILAWDGRAAYCLAAGMRKELRRESHLNMLLFERMIEDALGMGLDLDFNGSVLPGVERFFRGWGGELRPHYRVTKVPSAFAYFGWKGFSYLKQHRRRSWVAPA